MNSLVTKNKGFACVLYLFLEKIYMSHHPERKEKNCLNCGTTVQGRFCHICGQENIEPKESFWHLVRHFFYDITHFDGKFFPSLKYLFLRPGFLPKEYLAGRRASYLNPVRMYVFTSAFFFLLFFSFLYSEKNDLVINDITINKKSLAEIDSMDAATFSAFTANINKENDKPAVPMSREEFGRYIDTVKQSIGIHFTSHHYKSTKEYDSLLAAGVKKHNWIERKLIHKEIEMNEKYHNDPREIIKAFRGKLMHNLPQMLFISLPFLALVLKLLYVRRKQFYYIDHLVFSLYLFIFLFASMLIILGLSRLNSQLHWGVLGFILTLLYIGLFVYEYAAMRKFYRQGWFKTLIKFFLVNILFFMVIMLLFAVFVFFSFFEI
jgi:hypothetical protein